MPESCCCFGCSNTRKKGSGIAFHRFPLKKKELLNRWLLKIRREKFCPSPHHVVCSEHFTKDDYLWGIHPNEDIETTRHELKSTAVPTIFPSHPKHVGLQFSKPRNPPRKKSIPVDLCGNDNSNQPNQPKRASVEDHGYVLTPENLKEQLIETKIKLENKRKELKSVKQKVKRREQKISHLLNEIKNNQLITTTEFNLLNLNFGEKAFELFEHELKSKDVNKHGLRYSEELKKFAVTLHFYSPQAYEFVRQYLHLPHSSTIGKWSSSLNCEPGFLTEVVHHLKLMIEKRPELKYCTVMFDGMALKKETVYDPKSGKYSGFVDCGNFQPSCSDSLATEALVFMVVGLSGHWKFPIAYFLTDHLSGNAQKEILKQLIIILTDNGLVVKSVVCDGSYANQSTASLMGCSLQTENIQHYFPHPSNATDRIHFIFDACHLIKLVRNSFASSREFFHDNEEISWKYLERLNDIQQRDNLNIANKLKAKHIEWQQHKMNVKLAVQTLSSSVADAIDFLRDDLCLPDFAGSEKTTDFIRKMDMLFDFMNSRSPCGKGYKRPMNIINFSQRKTMLLNITSYMANLKDKTGQYLCKGRKKTAFVGFMISVQSVLDITEQLLTMPSPFRYVLTYKMSQDHLEMFFSRVRRRGGWNNNPNCLQFKWSLRSILMKNSIMPSKNANVAFLEPTTELFDDSTSAAVHHTNGQMLKFASLLSGPSEYHDQVLHYMAGYITRNVVKNCTCIVCCVILQSQTGKVSEYGSLTVRKDRGGLVYAPDDIFTVVKTADRIIRRSLLEAINPLATNNNIIRKIQAEILSTVRGKIFLDFNDHFMETDFAEDDHFGQLVNKLTDIFCRTLLHHHGRLYTERFILDNKASKRHKLTKTVLFLGQ